MINYHNIAKAIDFYTEAGYVRVEAPWWVSEDIHLITAPPEFHKSLYKIPENNKVLVASAEQSLLYMGAKDRLPPGRYQATTPCFRNESISRFSKKCFLKTELMITDKVDDMTLQEIVHHAELFFMKLVPNKNKLVVTVTQEGYDIEYDKMELGSYGIRSCEILDWVYGTGIAEPRFTKAIKRSEWLGGS